MLEKTQKIKKRYEELTSLIMQPDVIADNREWKKLAKERASLEEIAGVHDSLEIMEKEIINLTKMISEEKDADMLALLEPELEVCREKREKMFEEIKILLLPKDENDEGNVIIEIRGGAGGEESSLFAAVLMRMYHRYAERKRWNFEILSLNETELGGIKEAGFIIAGKGAYSKLKFESGVHRVQRVPETESQGRIHTSTATVAVLPEVEDVDFEILDKDLKVDTYRASGAGGQHVNKTESAIRITHLPTGMVVACQEERSQIKNREKAMKMLQSKLYDFYKTQQDAEYAQNRKNQVGTGDRSERIRTYNYPQGRMTDHRIGFTVYSLDTFLDGDLEELLEELAREDEKLKLENAGK